MEKQLSISYQGKRVSFSIPAENLLYTVAPAKTHPAQDEQDMVSVALNSPIGTEQIANEVTKGMRVVIIADDMTRPTPNDTILPPLLDQLNAAGVPDSSITILIALGTHRYMNRDEITEHYGAEVTRRVRIINHEWKDLNQLVSIGSTASGIPISVNRIAYEADYLIAVGSIVPHCLAGWGGGGKAVQPGICGWETTGRTHVLPAADNLFLRLSGDADNDVRREMEEVAHLVGLRFILNVVLDEERRVIHAVAGDQVAAHRAGVAFARGIYERTIPELADILVVSATPADLDYWQGMKPLSYAQNGLKRGGTIIFVGAFPEGISPSHPELETYGTKSYNELFDLFQRNTFTDLVCTGILLQHAKCLAHCQVLCVSEGLSLSQKTALGFRHAQSIEQGLEQAFQTHGSSAKVGVIDYGGDMLPRIR